MIKLNRFRAIALAAVMALAIAAPFAIAQSKDPGAQQAHGMRGGDRMSRAFFRNLDLTDAQKAQMKQIREAHSSKRSSFRPAT
ncbi:MAG TPA: Spy/CpxP family protein refolding chaperone [Blastocatellia bacterium]|nr:Spy/CpxP family protein refolding chaperone [Blastocatellia bacterium]